jgi:hypothetical protein
MSAVFLLTAWVMLGTFQQPPKPVSVCNILAEPKKYAQQIVSVRAALVSSLNDTDFDELGPLESERCYRAGRRDKLRIGIGGGAMPNPPEGFKPDMDSYDHAAKTIDAILEKDPQTKRIFVTVEGMVFDGGPEPSGVTRHPWHPALLLISKWKDVQKP